MSALKLERFNDEVKIFKKCQSQDEKYPYIILFLVLISYAG